MDREQQAAMARSFYERGPMTVHEVAAELSVSYGKAYALLKEANTPMRKRGSKPQ